MSNQHVIPPIIIDPIQEEQRRQRREAREERRRRHIRTRIILWSTIGSSVLLLGLMGFIYLQIQSIIAHNTTYPPINGIACDTNEQVAFHIHAHLTVYINGKHITIPKGIGIAADNSCIYWMHTHTGDGIIHIEAPAPASNLALDDFLTVWHNGFAKLNFPPEMNLTTGWKIYVNGQPFKGTVNSLLNTEVTLASHNVVTLDYGKNNPPPDKFYVFPSNLPT